MDLFIRKPLKSRDGQSSGQTVGRAIMDIIDTTSVAAVQQAGPLRVLHRVADRIAEALNVSTQEKVTLDGEETLAVRKLVENAVGLQSFYHRQLMARVAPDEVRDDERIVLLGTPGNSIAHEPAPQE